MANKYLNLLSPYKIGNVIFKNRMTASASKPHFVQGSEPYPTEAMITHFANKARNGAALVTCHALEQPVKIVEEKFFGFEGRGFARHRVATEGGMGGLASDQESYLSQMTEAVHFYGSKATIGIMVQVPRQYDVSAGLRRMGPFADGSLSEEIPVDLLDSIADEYALRAAFVKDLGFDGLFVHMAYRVSLPGRFLSPLTNKRTDKYGGSLENRARFPLMLADRIKQKCGKDFILELCISGDEPTPGGLTLDDTIEYAKIFAGHYDMLQLRAGDQDPAHPTGYNPERTPFLYMAEAVKKSGADIAVVTIGGYHDLGILEDVIASGKADFIGMARSWISNPEYGRMAYEGRPDDVVPCLRCNKCHVNTYTAPWASVCSVNPTWGLEHKIERMISPPTAKRNVAVVGGGPAGMEAALIASGRGHKVTLYEKSGDLGGLLKTASYPSFKWPLRLFRNYLIHQIKKANVKVHLNTEASAVMLAEKEYDAVFAAVGAEPIVPDIPGVDGENVVFAPDVYGNEAALSENLVIVGGGETGVETGMYLAENGHKVTVLEKIDMLAFKSTPVHFYTMFKEAWEKLENFNYILQARCNSIKADGVTYLDPDGVEHAIETGNVVIAVGMQPKNDLALEFYGTADRFFIIGDCNTVGSVQTIMRSSFSTASMI